MDPFGQNLAKDIRLGNSAINIRYNNLLMMIPKEDLHIDFFFHTNTNIELKCGIIFPVF